MKNLLIATVCFMVCFGVVNANAAPVGNIAKPTMLKSMIPDRDSDLGIIAEGEFDYGFDRKLKDQDVATELYFSGGKIGVVLANKFIAYGLLGGSWLEMEFEDEGTKCKIETEKDIAWGVGGTLLLYESEIEQLGSVLRLGIDGKYRAMELDLKNVIINDVVYDIPSGDVTSITFDYADWQVAGAASLQWGSFIPYVGVKYSNADATTTSIIGGTTYEFSDIEPEDNVGIFVGADLLVLDSISINVEGRFIDEEAVSFGVAMRF